MRRLVIVLLLMWALVAPGRRAEACLYSGPDRALFGYTSVEVLTLQSDVVMTARVLSIEPFGPTYKAVKVEPLEMLKTPAGAAVDRFVSLDRREGRWWPTVGETILCFGSPGMGGPYLMEAVPLDVPCRPASIHGSILRDLSMRPLASSSEVLDATRAALERFPVKTDVKSFSVAPFKFVVLPDDPGLLVEAREWARSRDPIVRSLAASVIAEYPDPQDTALLRTMLKDPFMADTSIRVSPWLGHEFVIRQTAAKALAARGEAVPETTLWLPRDDLYHPFPLAAAASLMLIPALGYAVLGELRRRRTGKPWRQRCFSVCVFLSLWLAVLAGAGWYRSVHTLDEVVWAGSGRMIDVYSDRGYLLMETARNWPADSPLVYFSLTPEREGPPSNDVSLRGGLTYEDFTVWQSHFCWGRPSPWMVGGWLKTRLESYPFSARTHSKVAIQGHFAAVYYGWIVIAFLLLPVGRFVVPRGARRWKSRQARRAMRRDVCLDCGYDLRMHAKGQRCPECGREKEW